MQTVYEARYSTSQPPPSARRSGSGSFTAIRDPPQPPIEGACKQGVHHGQALPSLRMTDVRAEIKAENDRKMQLALLLDCRSLATTTPLTNTPRQTKGRYVAGTFRSPAITGDEAMGKSLNPLASEPCLMRSVGSSHATHLSSPKLMNAAAIVDQLFTATA